MSRTRAVPCDVASGCIAQCGFDVFDPYNDSTDQILHVDVGANGRDNSARYAEQSRRRILAPDALGLSGCSGRPTSHRCDAESNAPSPQHCGDADGNGTFAWRSSSSNHSTNEAVPQYVSHDESRRSSSSAAQVTPHQRQQQQCREKKSVELPSPPSEAGVTRYKSSVSTAEARPGVVHEQHLRPFPTPYLPLTQAQPSLLAWNSHHSKAKASRSTRSSASETRLKAVPRPTRPALASSQTTPRSLTTASASASASASLLAKQEQRQPHMTEAARASHLSTSRSQLPAVSSVYRMQHATCKRNPFRVQSFEEFCANPHYAAPPGFVHYVDATRTAGYDEHDFFHAHRNDLFIRRLVQTAQSPHAVSSAIRQGSDCSNPPSAVNHGPTQAGVSAVPDSETAVQSRLQRMRNALDEASRGAWFLKWTRINHVHRRFVWLDIEAGKLVWTSSPQYTFSSSQLDLTEVTHMTNQFLCDNLNQRRFYQFTLHTTGRNITLATELRDKFKLWYTLLGQLTAANSVCSIPGLWSRPSQKDASVGGRGAMSQWMTRHSPLQAILDSAAASAGNGIDLNDDK